MPADVPRGQSWTCLRLLPLLRRRGCLLRGDGDHFPRVDLLESRPNGHHPRRVRKCSVSVGSGNGRGRGVAAVGVAVAAVVADNGGVVA